MIDTMGGPQQSLRISEDSILELKVVSEFFVGSRQSLDEIQSKTLRQRYFEMIQWLSLRYKEEKFTWPEGGYPQNINAVLIQMPKLKTKVLKAMIQGTYK